MLATSVCLFPVVSPNRTRCHGGIQAPQVPSGILSSDITQRTGCGSPNAPWQIKVLPGQRVNLTLFDFGRVPNDTTSPGVNQVNRNSHCHVYAIVKEKKKTKSRTICGAAASETRERNIFVSEGNEIEVRLVTSQRTKDGGQFLVKYEGMFLSVSECLFLLKPTGILL